MKLDHLAVAGETLDAAVAHVEDALGLSLGGGGQHPRYGTHNRLIGLEDGLYLEAIAVDPTAQPQEQPRWFDLDRFSGPARLSNWILRSEDLEAESKQLPVHAQRIVTMKRGALEWLMTVPADGLLPYDNLFPAGLQWLGAAPGDTLEPSGCRLVRLVVVHPAAELLQKAVSVVFRDDRVSFETGSVRMWAEFETPHGRRILE